MNRGKWIRSRRHRRGATFVTMLLAFPALIAGVAFATDVGVVIIQKQRLRRVVDAAAQTGGLQFGPLSGDASPVAVVKKYGQAHGYELTATPGHRPDVDPASLEEVCRGTWSRLVVEGKQQVPTFFFRYFGIENVEISARAVVQQSDWRRDGAVNQVSGTIAYQDPGSDSTSVYGALSPIALNVRLFEYGTGWRNERPSFANMGALPTATLVEGSAITGDPNGAPIFWPVQLGGNLENALRQGYSGTVAVGDKLAVAQQPMTTIAAGLMDRTGVELTVPPLGRRGMGLGDPFGDDPNAVSTDPTNNDASWRRWNAHRRVLLVPVVRQLSNAEVVVEGFAAIQVIRITRDTVQVQLVNVVAPQFEIEPGTAAQLRNSSEPHHFGLYGVRLVE